MIRGGLESREARLRINQLVTTEPKNRLTLAKAEAGRVQGQSATSVRLAAGLTGLLCLLRDTLLRIFSALILQRYKID